MPIVKTLCESEFIDEFTAYNRKDNFSYYSKQALFEYYENYSYNVDEPYELDIIAICCEWNECTTIDETINEYSHIVEPFDLETEYREDNEISTELDDNGMFVVEIDDKTNTDHNDYLNEFIFDAILEELENNTTIIRINEKNTIDPSMNVNGVLVQNY